MDLPAGNPAWLGATPMRKDGVQGVNFAFRTPPDATRVELCLFDQAYGAHETQHLHFKERQEERDEQGRITALTWHGFAQGLQEGQLYGLRVDGPHERGYNPSKLQLDPHAREVTGKPNPLLPVNRFSNWDNNGQVMAKARVVDWKALPPGDTHYLGATPDAQKGGTHFVFYTSAAAEGVTLCLFDKAQGEKEKAQFTLKAKEEVRSWEERVAYNPHQLKEMLQWKQAGGAPDPVAQDMLRILNQRGLPGVVAPDSHFLLATLQDGSFAIVCGKQDHFDFKATHLLRARHRGLEATALPDSTRAFDIRMDRIKVTPVLTAPSTTNPLEGARIESGKVIGYLWHGFAKGVGEGQLYGFRVQGPYNPQKRQFFNPHKLLVDPCAKAVTHEIHAWDQRHFHHDFEHPEQMSRHDNAEVMPKARVVDWKALRERAQEGLRVGALYPHADTNILEMHVKGGTCLNHDLAEKERGTYQGLGNPKFVQWVQDMGYTSLELMPVESFGTDTGLADRGLRNYWGYMTMAPMAPHTGYAATGKPEEELMQAIRKLKQGGIETVMDVVPNHTLEGGRSGPLINFRGMDDTLYLEHDYTGCGNTRDFGHPINRRMLLEELHYWQGLGVAGWRFDLATVVGRENGHHFNPDSPMMKTLRQDYGLDHGLRDVKFYGEPWDLGPNGYQAGRLALFPQDQAGLFSEHFAEWDGPAREALKTAALNPDVSLPRSEIVRRLSGSPDMYPTPQSHVVKVGSHDGMTLNDFTTFKYKRNAENGEGNRDGDHGIANFGVEGPTDDPKVNADRLLAQRLGIALPLFAQGVPLTVLGHERCKSQSGNSNPYCQDNGVTHIEWGEAVRPEGREMMAFARMVNQFRSKHFCLRRATHFTGQADSGSGLQFNGAPMKDVAWLDTNATELQPYGSMDGPGPFGILLSGDPGNSPPGVRHFTRKVQREGRDCPLLVLINPTMQPADFTLPQVPGVTWKKALNSADPQDTGQEMKDGALHLGHLSLVAFEGQREIAQEMRQGNGQAHNGNGKAHAPAKPSMMHP